MELEISCRIHLQNVWWLVIRSSMFCCFLPEFGECWLRSVSSNFHVSFWFIRLLKRTAESSFRTNLIHLIVPTSMHLGSKLAFVRFTSVIPSRLNPQVGKVRKRCYGTWILVDNRSLLLRRIHVTRNIFSTYFYYF